jgi:DNA-binding beta-propeller fold protein YncE
MFSVISSSGLIGASLTALLVLQSSSEVEPMASDVQTEAQRSMSGRTRRVLVVQEGPGKVVSFSTDDPLHRTEINVGEKPHEIEVTPDGKTAFVSNFGLLEVNHQIGTPGTTISVIDIGQGVERDRFSLPPGRTAPHGLKLRPPRYEELFTNSEQGSEEMVVFDADYGTVRRTFGLPHGVHNFIFDEAGTNLFAFTTENEIVRLDPDSGAVLAITKIAAPRGLAWTADHKRLIAGGKNELIFLNPTDLSIKSRFGNLGVGQIFYPTASPDGRWILAPAVLDGVVLVIETRTGNVARRIETGSPLQVIADGRHAWVSNVLVPPELLDPNATPRLGGIDFMDLATFTTVPVCGIPDANGIAVTPQRAPREQ